VKVSAFRNADGSAASRSPARRPTAPNELRAATDDIRSRTDQVRQRFAAVERELSGRQFRAASDGGIRVRGQVRSGDLTAGRNGDVTEQGDPAVDVTHD
jgi:hypothetical protein